MTDAPPPLDYQQDPALRAIRRGVRALVFLTLVNTVLLGAGFFAPAIVDVARQQWALYQKRRADAAAAVAKAAADATAQARLAQSRPIVLAAQKEAMAHLWPAGSLVFAEDFAVGTLPAVGTTSATLPATRNATTRGSAAAAASRPAFLDAVTIVGARDFRTSESLLFAHARRARPEMPDRLIVVTVEVEPSVDGKRQLTARTIVPTWSGDALHNVSVRPIVIDLSRTVRRRGESSEAPALRFYAGTPDPLDESRWTIRYEFGAGTGAIVCRLRADEQIDVTVEGPLSTIVN